MSPEKQELRGEGMSLVRQIEGYLKELLGNRDYIEVQRNELAEIFNCVPSQINYVLSTRFTPAHGYLVESRRGGGGYIRIRRIQYRPQMSPLMHVVNTIGDTLVPATAQAILDNLRYQKLLSPEAARLIGSAVSDQAYRDIPVEQRDRLRAALMKQMLTTINLQTD